jgi:hypothetical protein
MVRRCASAVSNHEGHSRASILRDARQGALLRMRGRHRHLVMAGLVPAIHVFRTAKQDVDARVKPGHDDREWRATLDESGPTAYLLVRAVA